MTVNHFEWTTPFRFISVPILHLYHSSDSWESGLPMSCVDWKGPALDRVRYTCLLYKSPSKNDLTSAEEEEKVKIGGPDSCNNKSNLLINIKCESSTEISWLKTWLSVWESRQPFTITALLSWELLLIDFDGALQIKHYNCLYQLSAI